MFIQKGKANWLNVLIVALVAGAFGGGLISYINDTAWQASTLSQESVIRRPEKPKTLQAREESIKQLDANIDIVNQETTSLKPSPEKPANTNFEIKQEVSSISQEEKKCEGINVTTSGTGECLRSSMEKYDALLEKLHSQQLSLLDEKIKGSSDIATFYISEREHLVKAMEAWKTYRKEACDAEYDSWAGGSIRVIAYASCYSGLTLEKILSM